MYATIVPEKIRAINQYVSNFLFKIPIETSSYDEVSMGGTIRIHDMITFIYLISVEKKNT